MKKLFCIVSLLFAFVANSFAEWSFFIPIGFNYSNQAFEADSKQKNYGVDEYFCDMAFYAVTPIGFTFGGKFDIGGGSSKDLYADDSVSGLALIFGLDLGWTLKTKKFALTFCGDFSINYDNFKKKQKSWTETTTGWGYSYDTEYTSAWNVDIFSYSLGGTVLAFLTPWNIFGFYAAFNVSKVLGGSLSYGKVGSETDYYGDRRNYGTTDEKYSLNGDTIYNITFGIVFRI